jgi:DNA-binding SARP family transcriptional activator
VLQIKLFGPTVVLTDGVDTPVSDLGGVKPRQILEILAAHPGAPVTKDRLADLLWEGEPPKSYVGTLESYVCVLRRRLGLGPGRKSPLATTSNGYLLDHASGSVDLSEFRRLVVMATTASPAHGLRLTQEAVALLNGELLASEAYASWARSERENFQRDVVDACSRAAQNAYTVHDFDAAASMSRLAIRYDSMAEDAYQHLMRALSVSGRGSQAIRAYFDLRTAMVTELGMEPGPVSRALFMDILCDGGEHDAPSSIGTGRDNAEVLNLRLLHNALESMTGVKLPTFDGPLAGMAERVLTSGLTLTCREVA